MTTTPPPLKIWADPDDTQGRALYRARADTLASAQLNYERRKLRLKNDGEA